MKDLPSNHMIPRLFSNTPTGLPFHLFPALLIILVLASCSKKNKPEPEVEEVETVESPVESESVGRDAQTPLESDPKDRDGGKQDTTARVQPEDATTGQGDTTSNSQLEKKSTEVSTPEDGQARPRNTTATASKETAQPPSKKRTPLRASVPDTAYLRLLSSPPYAQVWMDGKAVGETPMTEYLAVKSGSHELRLQHRNHPQKDTVISLARGDSLKLKIKLEEKMAGTDPE